MFGIDFDNPTKQDKFRVIYFPDANLSESEIVTDFSFLPPATNHKDDTGYYDDYLPFSGSCAVEFEIKYAPINCEDYQFNIFSHDDVSEDILEKYYEEIDSFGHKLLGYPGFTQEDPRTYLSETEPYILLMQIDSDSNNLGFDITWGDVGIANFFIRQSALENLDFTDVLYN